MYCLDSGNSDGKVSTAVVSLVVPDIPASQIVHALSEWEGMEGTIALFKDLISESSRLMFVKGMYLKPSSLSHNPISIYPLINLLVCIVLSKKKIKKI